MSTADTMAGSSSTSSSSTNVVAQETDRLVAVADNVDDGPEALARHTQVKVYKRRWYILAVFSLLGLFQGMVWNTFGPISDSVLALYCPDWGNSTLALLGNWGNIMYIIPVVPMMWYFESQGLRSALVLTGSFMVVGTLARALPFKPIAFTAMCHMCAILNGIAGIVVFSAPSAVSMAWFPSNERTTATAVALVANNLGNAISFLVGPAVVPDPNSASRFMNTTFVCPYLTQETRDLIDFRLSVLLYLEFGLVAIVFLAIATYFPSKPKYPPSLSSAVERFDFLPGVKSICQNKNAILMTLCYSIFNGLIASWYSVMDLTFASLPIGNDKDMTSGYIGVWSIFGNTIGTLLVSRIMDNIKGKMKLTLIILMVAAAVCWVWMGLICLRVIPFSLIQLYISTIMASSLTYSTGPIFFEFTVELVYPVPEGVVGGFLTCFYNLIGMIFLFLFYIPSLATSSDWIVYAIMGCVIAAIPLILLVREKYNRSVVDQFQEPSSSISEHASYPQIST